SLATGGIFMTIRSRPGMAYFHDQTASIAFLKNGVPQINTKTDKITQGIHDLATVMLAVAVLSTVIGSSLMSSLELSLRLRRAVEVQIFFGCHTFRNRVSAPIDTMAATTSTSHGP